MHRYPSLPIAYACMVSLIKIDGVKTLLFCPGLFELSSYVANFQYLELDQLTTASFMGLPKTKMLVDCKSYGLYRSRHGSARG